MVTPSLRRESRPAATPEVPSEAHASLPPGPARLAIGGRVIRGEVQDADAEIGFVVFIPEDSDVQAPAEGEQVRLAVGSEHRWRAHSEVVDADGPHWFLSLPRELAPTHRRKAARQPANGEWEFLPEEPGIEMDAEVHDISAEGIGLLVPPGADLASAGTRVLGRLVRVDGKAFPVEAEIRNLRRHVHSPSWKVMGCALHMAAEDRDALAQMLAEDA